MLASYFDYLRAEALHCRVFGDVNLLAERVSLFALLCGLDSSARTDVTIFAESTL
jgi:hypothetical protein